MATERQTVGEKRTKTETTIGLKESPASTGNATTVVKEDTGHLTVGKINENKKTMTLTTYLWEQYSLEKFKKKNGK